MHLVNSASEAIP